MKFTKIHTNSLVGLLFQTILTGGLIIAVVVLVTDKVATNGATDILTGALLPVIAMSIKELSETAQRFASMKDKDDAN